MKSEFVVLIDERNKKIKEHFGDEMMEMLNLPEEREWYSNNILPLDYRIISLANNILKYKIGLERSEDKVERITDVYQDEDLIEYYNKQKGKMSIISFTDEEIAEINREMRSKESFKPEESSFAKRADPVKYNDGKRPPRNMSGISARGLSYEVAILESDLD